MTTTSNTSCLENMMVLLAMRGGSACMYFSRPARGGQGEQNIRGAWIECSAGPGNLGKMFVSFIIALCQLS
jgi:hypothetical protein